MDICLLRLDPDRHVLRNYPVNRVGIIFEEFQPVMETLCRLSFGQELKLDAQQRADKSFCSYEGSANSRVKADRLNKAINKIRMHRVSGR